MKHDKKLLKTVHGSHEGIDKQVYTNNVIPLEDMKKIGRRFMGAGMSQSYSAIYWQEYFIESNRFQYIVELGSQKGALSTYLANMAAITESYFFDTYEAFPYPQEETDGSDMQARAHYNGTGHWFSREHEGVGHWFEKLAEISPYINIHYKNVFDKKTFKHIEENIKEYKTYIFCDGGNKLRELNLYARLLKSGDRIAVHDWGVEIHPEQVQPILDKFDLVYDEPFAKSATDLGTWIMPFRKK
tara:strand:+ start:6939 stop:7667 length:729 start_codon:yes stop_codon:yes gene_type:complete